MSTSYDSPDGYTTAAWDNPENCCNITYSGGGDFITTVKRGSYSGTRTPSFHQKVKDGVLLPLNPYERVDYLGRILPGDLNTGREYSCGGCGTYVFSNTLRNGVYPPLYLWNGLGYQNIGDPFEGVDLNALAVSAYADAAPDLDALTTFVELHKTFSLIRNARADAAKLISDALRGGHATARAASNAWLWWKYGWEQLYRDVVDIHNFIKHPLQGYEITGQAGTGSFDSEVITSGYDNGYEVGTLSHEVSTEVSVRANMIGRLSSKTKNFVANPLITLWELQPYSFVADYFVNVGDVLSAWDVSRSLSEVYVSYGCKHTIDVNSSRRVTGNSSSNNYVSVDGGGSAFEHYERKVRTAAPSPVLFPSVTVRLNSSRITTLAALLGQRIF